MASYLEKLRSSNVLGSSGGNPFTPREGNPFELLDQFMLRNPHLNDIGQQIVQGPPAEEIQQQEPMNTIFRDREMTPYQSAQIGVRREELGSKERIAQGNLGVKKSDLDIKQQRANVYDFKSKNPGSKLIQGKDGILRAFNPMTNDLTELGETGMSDEEIANLNQENKLEIVGATGEEARKTEGVRQTGRKEITTMQGENAARVKGIPSGTSNASDETKRAQLNYNRLINAKPNYRKYIKLDADGMPQIVEPGKTSFFGGTIGPSQIEYDEINNAIYGTPTKKIETPKIETKTETTEVIVEKDGKKFKLPAGQLNDAIAQGYKQVK